MSATEVESTMGQLEFFRSSYHEDLQKHKHDGCTPNKNHLEDLGSCTAPTWRVQLSRQSREDDPSAFVSSLRACTKTRDLHNGTRIHDEVLKRGFLDKCLDALAIMYAKCGVLDKALELLHVHKSRNVRAWATLIAEYVRHRQWQEALDCFEQMQCEGLSPNAVTFTCILKVCGRLKLADKGAQIHDEVARQGLLEKDVILGTALVDMYAKCGDFTTAEQVLQQLPSRDVVAWNALITGYTQQGQAEQALNCFGRMQRAGLPPSAVTFSCILKACGSLRALDRGEQIHDEISKQGLLGNDVVLGNGLMDMYAKCGALEKAAQVLLEELPHRDIVSWNVLLVGYAQQGHGEQALKYYDRMQQEGVSPDAVTFSAILKACGSIGAADKGKQIHEGINRRSLLGKDVILATALVDMYARCGALEKARSVHEEFSFRDIASWNALIAGYVQQDEGEKAVSCFELILQEGLSPDAVTFGYILKACGSLGIVERGEQVYDMVARHGLLVNDVVLGSASVGMFAKCGALVKARNVLEELPSMSTVAWNALIAGYGQQGQHDQILNCFNQMQGDGISPDTSTFSCVLNACSHLGLVDDGCAHFMNMSTNYKMPPTLDHYAHMVDLFGRAGHLGKAMGILQEMPSYDSFSAWSALLGACQKWGNVMVGRLAFQQAVEVDKNDAGVYAFMANIYPAAGMQEVGRHG